MRLLIASLVNEVGEFIRNCVHEGRPREDAVTLLQRHTDTIQTVIDEFQKSYERDEKLTWDFSTEGRMVGDEIVLYMETVSQTVGTLCTLYCIRDSEFGVDVKSEEYEKGCSPWTHASQILFPLPPGVQYTDTPINPWWTLPPLERLDLFWELLFSVNLCNQLFVMADDDEDAEEGTEEDEDNMPFGEFERTYAIYDFPVLSMHYREVLGIAPSLYRLMAMKFDISYKEDEAAKNGLLTNWSELTGVLNYMATQCFMYLGGELGHPASVGYVAWYYGNWRWHETYKRELKLPADKLADLGWATYWATDMMVHGPKKPLPDAEDDSDAVISCLQCAEAHEALEQAYNNSYPPKGSDFVFGLDKIEDSNGSHAVAAILHKEHVKANGYELGQDSEYYAETVDLAYHVLKMWMPAIGLMVFLSNGYKRSEDLEAYLKRMGLTHDPKLDGPYETPDEDPHCGRTLKKE